MINQSYVNIIRKKTRDKKEPMLILKEKNNTEFLGYIVAKVSPRD